MSYTSKKSPITSHKKTYGGKNIITDKQRHPSPMRKPPRMQGDAQNPGIKPVRKAPKSK